MFLEFPHNTLFEKLVFLKENHHPVFDYKDYEVEGSHYRIFNYNLANYKSFKEEAALECRGITFEIDSEGQYVGLTSLPMQKFFNYKENPFTERLENEKIAVAMLKEDGSLMSTYLQNGKVQFKSKGAFYSEQAVAANKLLESLPELEAALQSYEEQGYTVNLEYTAPDNQIVLVYQNAGLTILNVRARKDGAYVPFEEIQAPSQFIVELATEYQGMTLEEFSKLVYPMENIEGYVVMTESGHWVKFKTHWYCERHNAVSKFSPWGKKGRRELIFSVFEERVDDIRQLLENNKFMLDLVDKVENFVVTYMEEVDRDITLFVEENKNLAPKDYFALTKEVFKDDFLKLTCAIRLKNNTLNSIQKQMEFQAHGSKLKKYNDLFLDLQGQQPE
jgi:T4 RnlA family RNA ligase